MRPMQFVTLTVETCVACHCAALRSSKSGFPFANKACEIDPTLLMSVQELARTLTGERRPYTSSPFR